MTELTGTLRQRIDAAMRWNSGAVSHDDVLHFCGVYRAAGIELLPSAMELYKQYGHMFREHALIFEDAGYNGEFVFVFYSDLPVSDRKKIRTLQEALAAMDSVYAFAGQQTCPIGEIGFYYPPIVYIGEDGTLYCVHDYEDEIRVYGTPEDIMEYEL